MVWQPEIDELNYRRHLVEQMGGHEEECWLEIHPPGPPDRDGGGTQCAGDVQHEVAGLLACRELDGVLGLVEMAPIYLEETGA